MPEVNDVLCPLAEGGGPTTAVIKALQNLRSNGIKVGLTVTLMAERAAGLTRLVDLASYAGNVHGIALDLLRPLGRGARGKVSPPSFRLLAQQVRAALKRADELSALGGTPVRFRELERLQYQLRCNASRQHYC